MNRPFHTKILSLDDGAYDVNYKKQRYLLRKKTELKGKLVKLYAEELGGNDFISLNYYPQIKNGLLRPCEMPKEKVIEFIVKLKIFKS